MSVNESELPQFSAGPTTPLGQIINPNGLPVATKKQSGGLLKRIMANAKAMPKVKPKAQKASVAKLSRRGLESDQKVHIGRNKVKFY